MLEKGTFAKVNIYTDTSNTYFSKISTSRILFTDHDDDRNDNKPVRKKADIL